MYAVLIIDKRGIPGRAVSFEDFGEAKMYLADLLRKNGQREEDIQADVFDDDALPGMFLGETYEDRSGAWLIKLEGAP